MSGSRDIPPKEDLEAWFDYLCERRLELRAPKSTFSSHYRKEEAQRYDLFRFVLAYEKQAIITPEGDERMRLILLANSYRRKIYDLLDTSRTRALTEGRKSELSRIKSQEVKMATGVIPPEYPLQQKDIFMFHLLNFIVENGRWPVDRNELETEPLKEKVNRVTLSDCYNMFRVNDIIKPRRRGPSVRKSSFSGDA